VNNSNKTKVYDVIWGDIALTQCESKIIKTKVFQRLKYIKQMSMAYIGHAGAQHTRYEHSLGTLYVANYLAQNISIYDEETNQALIQAEIGVNNGKFDKDSEIIRHVRLAALLHDIGHAPMSHLFEEVSQKYPNLIKYSKSDPDTEKKLPNELLEITNDIYNPLLDKYSHEAFTVYLIMYDKQLKDIFSEYAIRVDWLVYLIDGVTVNDSIFATFPPYLKMFKQLISGDFDADRIDYVNRDFYYCGIKSAIDLPRYAKSLKYSYLPQPFADRKISEFNEKANIKDNAPDKKNQYKFEIIVDNNYIAEISNLLFQRFMLARRVHNNRLTKISAQLLVTVISDCLLKKKEFNSEDKDALSNIQWIFKAHTEYRDNDLIIELKRFFKYIEENPEEYKCKIYYGANINDILDGLEANKMFVTYMNVKAMSPLTRYPAYYLSMDKERIKKLEDSISKDPRLNKNAIAEFIYNKPSKMEISALDTSKDDKRILIDENISSLPHAIYQSGVNSLQLAIYSRNIIEYQSTENFSNQRQKKDDYIKKVDELFSQLDRENNCSTYTEINIKLSPYINKCFKGITSLNSDDDITTFKENDIDECQIYSMSNNVSSLIENKIWDEFRKNLYADAFMNSSKAIIPLHFIVLVIFQQLCRYAKENFNCKGNLLIKGDGMLHKFIRVVLDKYIKDENFGNNHTIEFKPSIDNKSQEFSIELLKATEMLCNWGYIDHIHKSTAFKKENGKYIYSNRVDRGINGWGDYFIEKCIEGEDNLIKIRDTIHEIVFELQDGVINQHKLLEKINQYKKAEKEYEEIRRIRRAIENDIRVRNGCVYKINTNYNPN